MMRASRARFWGRYYPRGELLSWWAEAAGKLSCKAAIIDGEIIAHTKTASPTSMPSDHKAPHGIVFFAFHHSHLDGQERKHVAVGSLPILRKYTTASSSTTMRISACGTFISFAASGIH